PAGLLIPNSKVLMLNFAFQFPLHDPGPRGSPHAPHGDCGIDLKDLAGLSDCAAKTDSSFCRSAPWHAGHDGDCPSRIRNSNCLPQSRHSYSKRGIGYSNAVTADADADADADCGLRIADCGLIAECGMRNAECGMRNADCGLNRRK